MKITRRTFLKVSGVAAGTVLMGRLGFDLSPVEAYARELRIKGARETTTVCCYCSVGCGILAHKRGKGNQFRGRPRSPNQRRIALLEGIVALPGGKQQEPSAKAALPGTRFYCVEGRGVGLGPRSDRPQD
jgi:anaerobic selenocysteine-containing dehydrogenase